MKLPPIQRFRLAISLLAVGLMHRLAPWAHADEISWFRLYGLPEISAGMEIDASTESDHVSGTTSTYNTLFLTPTAGLRTTGSIYHPNLLYFDFSGELGWGWNQMTSSGPGNNQTINESDKLTRYQLQVDLLREKPYNASFFASEDHTYRDYGSFDTFAVDSERYGGRMDWNTASLNLHADYGYNDEKDTGLVDSSEVAETYFNFLGIHKRRTGQTTLVARWDQFDNILSLGGPLTTVNESVGIADSETIGSRQQTTIATGVSASHSEYSGQQLDTVNANGNVETKHSRNLSTFLIFNFEENYLHPATDTYVQGTAGVRHQLYDSLTSTLDAHGSYQDNNDSSGGSTTDLYGLGLSENYQKRIQNWGRLTMSLNLTGDHQDDTSSGDTFTAIGESHQLYLPTSPNYRPVYLARPRVILNSIQVTAAGQLLVADTDYEVVNSGELTEVRLISPPSAHLQLLMGANDNLAVTISYQSESNNNAAFESLTSGYEIRLDMFSCFGIYGRLNWMDNNAPPTVITQTLTDLVGGVDYHWRWFRTGAEYEDYDSNYTQYTSMRFFQDFTFQLNHRSSLALNFNETLYHYAQNGDQTLCQFTTRYNLQLWSSFSCYLQGGASWQEVLGGSETDGSAEVGLSWTRGKLSVRAGYQYNEQTTANGAYSEDRSKDRIFAYLKRSF